MVVVVVVVVAVAVVSRGRNVVVILIEVLCPSWWRSLSVHGFRQSCEVVLVGQRLSLFDFNWGTLSV